MGKSILLNPAWYRDEEGRTGYKTREWEAAKNKQKEVVKDASKPTSPVGIKIDKIDDDLISVKYEAPVLTEKELKKQQKEEKKAAKEKEKQEKKDKKEKEKLERKLSKKKGKEEDKEGNEQLEVSKEVDGKKVNTTYATVTMTVKKEKKDGAPAQVTVTRKDSSDSSQGSKITVNRLPMEPKKKIEKKEEEKKISPPSKNIGERRDSSLSKLSKVSFVSTKSVKFNDRVQMREIERRHISTSSDDDAAIMSDDELSRPDSEKRRKVLKLLQNQYYEERMLDDDQQEHQDIYDEDLDDFEEQERLAILAEQQQRMLDEEEEARNLYEQHENVGESASLQSFYEGEVEPERYEDSDYVQLSNLPLSVRNAIIAEMQARPGIDQPLMGSMSRLHANDGSSDASLLEYPVLPRSASGYFDPNYMGQTMNHSYRQALYPNQPQPSSSQMQQSFYENREEDSQSITTPVPSPPRKDMMSSAREQFFSAVYDPKESSTSPLPNLSHVGSSGSFDGSTVTRRDSEPVEDEMRRRFVARFGPRKAPMAREEDPADPEHVMMGSTESVISTDSRESVVSAASNKAELVARRNFNY